ncbi:MAG: hypothetical protein ACJARY_003077 [Candidatus Azotimanducaceae bacterium]
MHRNLARHLEQLDDFERDVIKIVS